ncbi:MAG: diguanylate cyclase response regulator [Candidatus Aminicenantes bacterium]|nr:diguanylate cyclase response regulator [Candidatus Aminicenantes bacterium]
MNARPIKIFLVEGNPSDARLIRELLSEIPNIRFTLEQAERLRDALQRLSSGEEVDVVLLDLSLPDSRGQDTFNRFQEGVKEPGPPVIVLTQIEDETAGVGAVQSGAQDYLVKGRVDGNLIARSIRFAIERQRMVEQLKLLSVKDDLTGIYNRRGFLTFGGELLKLGRRVSTQVFLIFAGLDRTKWVNETLGKAEGDKALKEIAALLRRTYRETDTIARIGGDEFVVMGVLATGIPVEVLAQRLQRQLEEHNRERADAPPLALNISAASYPIGDFPNIDDLLQKADEMMYEQKRAKA